MQMSNQPVHHNKHSLVNVMNRFIAATNNMDETILLPSLLRDMPLDDAAGEANNNNTADLCVKEQPDMYQHYLRLKSIKNDMEWGLLKREVSRSASFLEMAVHQEEHQTTPATISSALPNETDLEEQFHYHLRGLFGVLSKLTTQADNLTNRYKREIGGGNFIR